MAVSADTPSPLQGESLRGEGLRHGFFSRHYGTGDIAAAFAVSPENLLLARQIHSATAMRVDRPWEGEAAEVDGLATDRTGLALAIATADCMPVLLADTGAGVIGACHAGWRGALAGICEATLEEMLALGADKERIRAALGPAISQRAYEVDRPFRDAFARSGESARAEKHVAAGARPDHWLFDLGGYVTRRLRDAGVRAIDILSPCTHAENALYFSHRRASQERGRQISAIMLVAS